MADLITRANYKSFKGISSSTRDNLFDAIIPLVSKFIKSYCKRTFVDYYGSPSGSPKKTEYFDSNLDEVFVTEFPVRESPVPTVSYSIDGGVTYTALVLNTDYFIDYNAGIVTTGDGSSFNAVADLTFRSLKVVYNGGYASAPEDIELAAYLLMDYFVDKQYIENKVINTVTMQTFDSNKLPYHIKNILERHREFI